MNALALALALTLIGDDDFALREHGSAILRRAVAADPGWAGPVAARAADGSPSAEARTRSARVLGQYRRWVADTFVPSTCPCWPCIDAAPLHWEERWELVREWRANVGSAPTPAMEHSPYWWGWRRATELYVRQQIRDGWSPAEADAFLSKMWAIELEMTAASTPQHFPAMVCEWRWTDGFPRP